MVLSFFPSSSHATVGIKTTISYKALSIRRTFISVLTEFHEYQELFVSLSNQSTVSLVALGSFSDYYISVSHCVLCAHLKQNRSCRWSSTTNGDKEVPALLSVVSNTAFDWLDQFFKLYSISPMASCHLTLLLLALAVLYFPSKTIENLKWKKCDKICSQNETFTQK